MIDADEKLARGQSQTINLIFFFKGFQKVRRQTDNSNTPNTFDSSYKTYFGNSPRDNNNNNNYQDSYRYANGSYWRANDKQCGAGSCSGANCFARCWAEKGSRVSCCPSHSITFQKHHLLFEGTTWTARPPRQQGSERLSWC